jgi:D-alanyl-D-alanine carboxypeptidase
MRALAALVLTLGMAPQFHIGPVDVPPPPVAGFPDHEPPEISASAWVLYSVDEGAILLAVNPDTLRAPASVTKVMTALVVVANTEPGETVTISATADATPIGFVGQEELREGQVWTVEDLLSYILVISGNDGAVALAEHVAGSEEDFVVLMNEMATQLAMDSTTFKNANGLDAVGHLSTARDLIRLGLAAIDEPRIVAATSTKYIVFELASGEVVEGENTNKLLGSFPGVMGLKTGDTVSAGLVLLSYLDGPHEDYVAVVMGADNHMEATRELLAYALETLGPKDHFYSGAAGSELLAGMPDWFVARATAAGPLDDGGGPPAQHPPTPAERVLIAQLRDLLPGVLGGDSSP